ncbi:HlyD family efflux transporter periplasmic adaptor subunit [Intestinimonas massiliensis]|uniref:HlyD family efflux transporter periplasmic adaptor subunit n=1 Tax=Intestinimonas massiliensis (ex Afouda et al. 2020) TaxID=1673721 RepID=A0AAW5JKD4_9FIRM|nr:HlyD family efflux transporter periplasmic adaptor subunit [Intestinimonas massiliensis (ex Afouda et al. 2020)]MCQ4769155.1 HlyD family efflux transporter periplasmic adaptor subunit [Intestinimonas massiliensis (ex Afouda et al. 2020)]
MAEMTQQNAPVTEAPAPAAPPARPSGTSNQKKKQRKKVRNTIIALVVLAVLAVGGFFLYRFLTAKEAVNSQIQTQPAQISSIQSMVQGSGNAKAKDTAAITLTQGGTVQEVFVTAGDTVTEGQPLYTIRSQAAEDEVTAAQEKVSNLQKDMADLHKALNNLTVRAPFAGKLIEVSEFETGSTVSSGASVATLVNDKKLKLSLYFSYAYENDIYVGQSVSVSIPAVMDSFTGSVEQVNKVHYITPEGADHFEVVVAFDNPGTLTEGMTASAALTAANGTPIYPYENGTTKYYETRKIVTEAGGPLLSANLLCYSNVSAGQTLLSMGSDTIDSDIRAKQKEIDDAMEKLTEAQKALNNFNAVAPIDGTVTTCTLAEGAEVKSGDTVIIISNTTTMLVNITVDDRNISFVKPGMTVDLTDWNGNVFTGTVSSINTGSAEAGQGMTSFPVTLTVDNYDGSLLEGVWLDYSFVASQSDDCIVVPMQSVKYVSDENGETASVVFIKVDSKPENTVAIDIPPTEPGATPLYPSESEGFYPVPVTTGLSDNYNVEIKEGLTGDEEVFVNYYVEQAWG